MIHKTDSIYRLSMRRLVVLLLPIWLRVPSVVAILQAATAPLQRHLRELRDCRNTTTYRLTHNGQTCKLRGMLNDEFDREMRRIVVRDAEADASLAVRVFLRTEQRPKFTNSRQVEINTILNRRGYTGSTGTDFVIEIPAEVLKAIDVKRLAAMVNSYKLAGRRWKIMTI